jgi:hypothetical protein
MSGLPSRCGCNRVADIELRPMAVAKVHKRCALLLAPGAHKVRRLARCRECRNADLAPQTDGQRCTGGRTKFDDERRRRCIALSRSQGIVERGFVIDHDRVLTFEPLNRPARVGICHDENIAISSGCIAEPWPRRPNWCLTPEIADMGLPATWCQTPFRPGEFVSRQGALVNARASDGGAVFALESARACSAPSRIAAEEILSQAARHDSVSQQKPSGLTCVNPTAKVAVESVRRHAVRSGGFCQRAGYRENLKCHVVGAEAAAGIRKFAPAAR